MARKNPLPSQKDIKKALSQASFNPREPGPMAIIAEFQDFNYFISRAFETLRELPDSAEEDVVSLLDKAMSLLALAKVKYAKEITETKAGT